ncbi:Ig-like domain repeat protein [Leucobacter weissii]|uniref:Ig-like domain repeat protein n=1 Tax=Leucobacter weissii TaxID=1983706 RepID=A0A939MKK3_9MICO|nr:Ig-like domain-containing protein [Leucobacter weissii]MBO1901650.1 Ig-like domain repeat protein [Leucobacter weissii]
MKQATIETKKRIRATILGLLVLALAFAGIQPAYADDSDPVQTTLTATSKLGSAAVQSGPNHVITALRPDWVVTAAIVPTTARGQVDLVLDGTVIASGQLGANGTAAIAVPAAPLVVGEHVVTLRYLGDQGHAPADASFSLRVDKNPTYPRLVGSHTTTFATNTRFSADRPINVRLDSLGVLRTGTVRFEVDGVPVGSTEVNLTTGVADLPDPIRLKAGRYTVYGYYSGNDNYLEGNAGRAFNVDLAPTTAELFLDAEQVGASEPVRATARVSAVNSVVNEGSVEFFVAGESAGSVEIVDGEAVLELEGVDVGRQKISAEYTDGEGTYIDSRTSEVVVQVDREPTSTEFEIARTELSAGDEVTVSARVTPADATGSVQFSADGRILGHARVIGGVAQRSIVPPVGAERVEARYLGDRRHEPSGSASIEVSVSPRSTSTSIELASERVAFGASVEVTARVLGGAIGAMELYLDGVIVARSLAVDGEARFELAGIGVGAHGLTARYIGSETHLPSESGTRTLTVSEAEVDIRSLSLSRVRAVYGSADRVTATVEVSAPDGVRIRLLSGTRDLGTGAVKDGKVSWSLPARLEAGRYTLQARHVLSTGVLGDSSAPRALTVQRAKPTAIQASGHRFKKGTKPRVTVKVGALSNGSSPTGRVRVKVGSYTKTVVLRASAKGTVTVTLGRKFDRTVSARVVFVSSDARNVAGASTKTVRLKVRR